MFRRISELLAYLGRETLVTKHGESMLVSRGRSFVKLWVLEANHQARRFYEAMGYEVDGVTKEVNLGAPLTAIRYCKKLKDAEHQVGGEA